jgi:hypothetical protein
VLGDNLVKIGIPRPKGDVDAHHIVSWDHEGAENLRNMLNNAGIDIDEAANGVFLPTNQKIADIHPELGPSHKKIHTPDYYTAVEARLANKTAAQMRFELQKIATELVDKTFPW